MEYCGRSSNALEEIENQTVIDESISYMIYKYEQNSGVMLIKFQDDTNGIDRIECSDNKNIIKCNGKNIISIDYAIIKNQNYEFKMYTTLGKEVISNITIDDNFLYENGISFENKKSGEGYKLIKINYLQNLDSRYKQYYRLGEEGEWEEYVGVFWIFDYDVVKQELVNTEDNTLMIYAKSVDSANNEVIISKKYDIDINARETESTEESLLQAVSQDYFSTGTFKIKVKSEIYNIHAYEFNESQVWDDNVTFGTEKDVATASEYAKNMVVVKVNGDLTINSGVTVTAYASAGGYGGPKGMMIYCTGTLTNNGTISMTARGAKAEGQDVYLYKNLNGTYEYVPAVRRLTEELVWLEVVEYIGKSGVSGTERQTGGGGSGADGGGDRNPSGAGAAGTSYSGGTGGGGARNQDSTTKSSGYAGAKNGGAGGSVKR